VLLKYQERLDQHVLYVSDRHWVGVVFQMVEDELPPDMVVNVHADDEGGTTISSQAAAWVAVRS
ncbi:unnamed protein product, partial [Symbiodinium pilosum]